MAFESHLLHTSNKVQLKINTGVEHTDAQSAGYTHKHTQTHCVPTAASSSSLLSGAQAIISGAPPSPFRGAPAGADDPSWML